MRPVSAFKGSGSADLAALPAQMHLDFANPGCRMQNVRQHSKWSEPLPRHR